MVVAVIRWLRSRSRLRHGLRLGRGRRFGRRLRADDQDWRRCAGVRMFNAVELVNRRNDQLAEPRVIVVLGRVLALNRVEPKSETAEVGLRHTRIRLSLEGCRRVVNEILKGMKAVGCEPRLVVRGHSLSLAKALVRKLHLE